MNGYDTMPQGWSDIPHATDAISQRRTQAAASAPGYSGGTSAAYGGSSVGGSYGSSGDPMFDYFRSQALSDAGARTRGARLTAMDSSPNDPSLAAFGGLQGEIGGQGQAAADINQGALGWDQQQVMRAWQEHMAQLQHQWQMQQQQSQNSSGLWQDLGGVVGAGISTLPYFL